MSHMYAYIHTQFMNQDISSYCPQTTSHPLESDIFCFREDTAAQMENKKTTAMNIKTQKAFPKNFYIVLHKNLFMYREYIRNENCICCIN